MRVPAIVLLSVLASSPPVDPWLQADFGALPFHHHNAASQEKYLVETMGSGVVLFDMDEDGHLDVYLVNGAPLAGSPRPEPPPANALFRNRGNGTFEDVTIRAGVGDLAYGMGGCAGDYDNDGDADLYITNFGPDVLFRNEGDGTFARVSSGPGAEDLWSTSCSFADLDGDGFLDLYVARYVDFALDNHKYCGLLEPGYRVYCEPEVYDGVPDALYWNDHARGAGWTEAPLDPTGSRGKGLGVVVTDLDGDGLLDVYVANDRTPNTLWRNRGDRRLEESGLLSGVALSAEGRARAGMGVDVAEVDGDGLPDLVVTNFSREANALFRSLSPGLFADQATPAGLGVSSFLPLGFGVNFWDADNDGDQDLFVANGHVTDNIELYQPDLDHAQPDQLFLNEGSGRFLPAGDEWTAHLEVPRVSRGSAVGDLDRDGRLDLVVTHAGGPALVFWNRGPAAGGSLALRLVGMSAAREPLGASLLIEAAGRKRRQILRGGSSYLSQGSNWVHVGLGGAMEPQTIEVEWGGGSRETFSGAPAGRRIILKEGLSEPLPVSPDLKE